MQSSVSVNCRGLPKKKNTNYELKLSPLLNVKGKSSSKGQDSNNFIEDVLIGY